DAHFVRLLGYEAVVAELVNDLEAARTDLQHVLDAVVENTILRIAEAARRSLQGDGREHLRLQLRIVLAQRIGHQRLLTAEGQGAEGLRTDARIQRTVEGLAGARGVAG